MMQPQAGSPATPMTVRDVLFMVLQADAYPILGNEDVPVALCMQCEMLQHAATAVCSPEDPPEFAHWLAALQQPDLGTDAREEILWAMYGYFDPNKRP